MIIIYAAVVLISCILLVGVQICTDDIIVYANSIVKDCMSLDIYLFIVHK